MIAEKNKVVSLSYQLREGGAEGEIIETTEKEQPFVFLFGHDQVIPGFEQNLISKTIGDSFEFTVDAEEGYGDYDEEAIVEIPLDAFKVEGKVDYDMLSPGNMLPMRDQDGHMLQGIVVEVTEEVVIMDFNHPMAGKTLHFKGEIVAIREASADEVSHGHAHGPGGHHH